MRGEHHLNQSELQDVDPQSHRDPAQLNLKIRACIYQTAIKRQSIFKNP